MEWHNVNLSELWPLWAQPVRQECVFYACFHCLLPPIPTPQFPSFLGSGSKSSRRKTREETKWDDDTERVIESCDNHNNKHRWRQPPGNAAITHEQTDKDEDIHKKVWKRKKQVLHIEKYKASTTCCKKRIAVTCVGTAMHAIFGGRQHSWVTPREARNEQQRLAGFQISRFKDGRHSLFLHYTLYAFKSNVCSTPFSAR